MPYALAILVLVLCLLIGAAGGAVIGYRRGKVTGRNDTVRQLVQAKDQECWTAAHYLEADAAAKAMQEAETVRIVRPGIGKLLAARDRA